MIDTQCTYLVIEFKVGFFWINLAKTQVRLSVKKDLCSQNSFKSWAIMRLFMADTLYIMEKLL